MESPAFEHRLAPCAEFPNDNHGLHQGAIWACVELGRVPACQRPAPDPPPAPEPLCTPDLNDAVLSDAVPYDAVPYDAVPYDAVPYDVRLDSDLLDENGLLDEDAEPIEIVDELSFDEPTDDSFAEQAPADPFAQLVAALGEVARALGAGADAIACLDALFGQTRLEGIAPGCRAEALLAGGMLTESARGFARSGAFTAKVLAWQGILRGETEEFSLPDGGALEPLDEWTADVLARVLGPPARADGIRRDLRRRGVAAFGLVSQAA